MGEAVTSRVPPRWVSVTSVDTVARGEAEVNRPLPGRLVSGRACGALTSRSYVGAVGYLAQMVTRRHWVIVASRDHARRGIGGGFVMANHGKRPPLARMSPGDGVLVYSPTTTYPRGEPLRAITVVGDVTGAEPEPSEAIPGGFRRAARLQEIEPLPLADIREHLPVSRLRLGFFELDAAGAEAIRGLVAQRRPWAVDDDPPSAFPDALA